MRLLALPADARPDLPERMRALLQAVWPPFVIHAPPLAPPDRPADAWLALADSLPRHQIALLDADSDSLLAVCSSVPLCWPHPLSALPEEGWDWALRQSGADRAAGRPLDTLCALAVTIAHAHQGKGLSRVCLGHLRQLAHRHGCRQLIVPVRPSWKARYPLADIADYLRWQTPEGLPLDPWLRTHLRLGGQIVAPCRRSMQMIGAVADWAGWLGLPLPQSGAFPAPGLLQPLQVDLEADQCRYTEPNIWVVHAPQAPAPPG